MFLLSDDSKDESGLSVVRNGITMTGKHKGPQKLLS